MRLARSFGVVALLTLVASFLGYVRDAAMAARFGASIVTDAYFAAFFVPNTLSLILLSNSVAIVFLPIFVEAFQRDKRHAWKIASSLFNLTFLLFSDKGFASFYESTTASIVQKHCGVLSIRAKTGLRTGPAP